MKNIYYSWEIQVAATKDFPAHTTSNAASANGTFKSYQEAKDYLDIALQETPGALSGKVFRVIETSRTIQKYEV